MMMMMMMMTGDRGARPTQRLIVSEAAVDTQAAERQGREHPMARCQGAKSICNDTSYSSLKCLRHLVIYQTCKETARMRLPGGGGREHHPEGDEQWQYTWILQHIGNTVYQSVHTKRGQSYSVYELDARLGRAQVHQSGRREWLLWDDTARVEQGGMR
ncbi:hypothetical protein BD289DRAFT_359 [Coniella lustricola]|uniref:Uncharacterized protein n=1 Tax=Coniella lustricola TaxID=2025994 RepID=A0A2T3ANH2_9PEZI|nr:hypothetical protein BD289DRAFT_359 [Coniella lustricola]